MLRPPWLHTPGCLALGEWSYRLVIWVMKTFFVQLFCVDSWVFVLFYELSFNTSYYYLLFIWKFSVHILLKPSLKDFEQYLASMWNQCNCVLVWTFFGIAFLWDWTEKWPFPVLWPLLNVLNQKRKVSLFVEKVLCQILVSFQKSGNIRTGNYFQEKY